MAPRFWTGYLKLSLVTCPVALQPATTDSEKVRFHTLNRSTGQRVVSRYVDAVTNEAVNDDAEVKGYEVDDGRYIAFEDEELAAVGLESARSIDIDLFTSRSAIAWIWLDSCYFLLPNDPVGEEAYAVIREAMAATDTVGISRVVLGRRERAVMLEPRGKGIIAWTLRFGDEVRRPSIYFGDLGKAKPDEQLLELADQLVVKKTQHWSEDFMKDPIQEHLLRLIATKQKRSVRKGAPQGAKVVNIFEALKASLDGGKASSRTKPH